MSNPNIIDDINERVKLTDLVNLIYPVGSIYFSVNDVSPATFLGGTWEQIKDTFLLCSGDTYSSGSTGGEATHTLTVDESPAHTHTRGTMDITGYFTGRPHKSASKSYGGSLQNDVSGVFTFQIQGSSIGTTAGTAESSGLSDCKFDKVNFKASRSWTGETSSSGSNAAHNNMPPYLAVYVWKRTA